MASPYATLQLRPPYRKATLDQIKQQRKKLELKYHPDKQSSEASEEFLAQCAERLAAVGAAFALIGTETARAEYDAASAAHSSTSATTSPPEEKSEAAIVAWSYDDALRACATVAASYFVWPLVLLPLISGTVKRMNTTTYKVQESPAAVAVLLACLAFYLSSSIQPLDLSFPQSRRWAAGAVCAIAAGALYPSDCGVDSFGLILGGLALVPLLLFAMLKDHFPLLEMRLRFCVSVVLPLALPVAYAFGLYFAVVWVLRVCLMLFLLYNTFGAFGDVQDGGRIKSLFICYVGLFVASALLTLLSLYGVVPDLTTANAWLSKSLNEWHDLAGPAVLGCATIGYILLLRFFCAEALPSQEPLLVCRSCWSPLRTRAATHTCLHCDALFCSHCHERIHARPNLDGLQKRQQGARGARTPTRNEPAAAAADAFRAAAAVQERAKRNCGKRRSRTGGG